MSKTLLRCQGCRVSLLDTFASLAGLSVAPTRHAPIPRAVQPPQRRALSSTFSLRNQAPGTPSSRIQQQPLQNQSVHDASLEPLPAPTPSSEPVPTTDTTEDTTPWYLRVTTPTPPAPISPLLASQDLPPLPTNPPPILYPILEHLSISTGLDNLTLLDLRHLDPPPALGANLLMIIGTARSVKHLNVSADRFCRWMRSKYKLRPYADGLLGRNELKLKLRRRARKMKLLGRVGNTVAMGSQSGEGVDDGITTGWICVNLGIVEDEVVERAEIRERERTIAAEAAERKEDGFEDDAVGGDAQARQETVGGTTAVEKLAEMSERDQTPKSDAERAFEEDEELDEQEEEYQNPENEYVNSEYVGFGSHSAALRIVVQMFTEGKRMEMDLEGLWDARNTKKWRRDEKADKALEEIGELGNAEAEADRGEEIQVRRRWKHIN